MYLPVVFLSLATLRTPRPKLILAPTADSYHHPIALHILNLLRKFKAGQGQVHRSLLHAIS